MGGLPEKIFPLTCTCPLFYFSRDTWINAGVVKPGQRLYTGKKCPEGRRCGNIGKPSGKLPGRFQSDCDPEPGREGSGVSTGCPEAGNQPEEQGKGFVVAQRLGNHRK